MRGIFVDNGSLRSPKFREPWDMMRSSFQSAGVVLEHRYNTDLCFPIGDFESLEKMVGDPDFVLFWDKDTLLASNLELAGLHVMNGSRCIGICDDKSLTHIELCRARIPSPRTSVLPLTFSETDLSRTVESLESSFGYPMVVKDCHGSFGEQVRMVSNHDELLLEISDTRVPTIVQEFVPTGGRDVRVEVVGGEPIAAMERKAPEGDFRSNVTIGGSMKAVNPSGDVEELAIRAAECVGAGFCGVDILYSPSGPTVCEVNSNAHIRNITDCTGIRVADLIRDHVVSECKR